MYPDARAAALAVEAVAELTGLEIPLSELLANAQNIEDSVREVLENTQTLLPGPETEVFEADRDVDPSFG